MARRRRPDPGDPAGMPPRLRTWTPQPARSVRQLKSQLGAWVAERHAWGEAHGVDTLEWWVGAGERLIVLRAERIAQGLPPDPDVVEMVLVDRHGEPVALPALPLRGGEA